MDKIWLNDFTRLRPERPVCSIQFVHNLSLITHHLSLLFAFCLGLFLNALPSPSFGSLYLGNQANILYLLRLHALRTHGFLLHRTPLKGFIAMGNATSRPVGALPGAGFCTTRFGRTGQSGQSGRSGLRWTHRSDPKRGPFVQFVQTVHRPYLVVQKPASCAAPTDFLPLN